MARRSPPYSFESRPRRSSARCGKKGAPVGLIVGLCLGGAALLVGVVVIVVLSTGDKDAADPQQAAANGEETPADANSNPGIFGLPAPVASEPEPEPFHNQGLYEVGRLVRQEVKLSNARFTGFDKTDTGFPYAAWKVDYEFVNGGFQPARFRDAYELRIRGSKLHRGTTIERAWKIRHPGNQQLMSEQQAHAQMLEPKGTVEVTWVVTKENFAPPYVFWVYREDPVADELFLRVSNYVAADGEVRN